MQLKYQSKDKAVLVLEDGKVFEGKAAGAKGITTGEICFNTGMTGYQEIFTDPSYYGQIIVMNNAHIGNYGVNDTEVESDAVMISGMICKKFNHGFSRYGKNITSLEDYFVSNNIVSISDVDTRALVRYIRDKGAMNCVISSTEYDLEKLKGILKKVPSMEGLELSSRVTTKKAYEVGNPSADYRVALLDFGVKKNIFRSLVERDCFVKVFPMKTPLAELEAFRPSGYMLSNGPGDPGVMKDEIGLVRQIVNTGKPVFGICLGHQLLALSQGISTYKLHRGHRGINHPVKNLVSGKCEITSQNHGFTIRKEDVAKAKGVEITHVNLNDETLEGIRLTGKPVFSVQYHPEACPGPHDSRYLFDEFVEHMRKVGAKKLEVA